jgi:hypothetical protein
VGVVGLLLEEVADNNL